MILFTNNITPRLSYIAEFFERQINEHIILTENRIEFTEYEGVAINYSNERLRKTEMWIQPHLLLFETGIKEQKIECFDINGVPAFFRTGGDFPFDIFAASFYLISRYEEYLPHKKDKYGRYAFENSLAWKEKFLDKPLVNYWMNSWANSVQEMFPFFQFEFSFRFIATYDIDEAYSFRNKSWWRSTGGAIKDLLKGNFSRYRFRKKVLKDELPDPFDSYDWMDELHKKYNIEARYFFLVTEKTGKYDRNILPSSVALRELIQRHSQKYQVGVHPSWQSGDDPGLLVKEKQFVESAAGRTIVASRQHFIRMTIPDTYRTLLDAGLRGDNSMGYGSINGFRASVASSFYWYDLENEKLTPLLICPFCYMEANSFFEQKMSPEQAYEEMMYYYNEVKNVNGVMFTIWHNTFLGTDPLFKGWREVYQKFIEKISS